MANAEADMANEAPGSGRPGKRGPLIGAALALILGGGGFYAVWSGLILAPAAQSDDAAHAAEPIEALPDVAFVPLDPIVVSLGPSSTSKHLKFSAQLEVPTQHEAEVTRVMPRVVDVLNSYLRAIDPAVMSRPDALIQLRAQMLRRVQLVVGEGRVRDLLVMEFVLN